MARDKARAEQKRAQALAEKRLRGHRIKHGLEELGDLDAPSPPQRSQPPVKRAKQEEGEASSRGHGNKEVRPVALAKGGEAAETYPCYKSVFGDGWAAWRMVKRTLFSPASPPSEKLSALQEVRLWHARVRRHRVLPSYVEATELLLQCVLLEEQSGEQHATSGPDSPGSVADRSEVLASAYGAAIARSVHVMTGSFATAAATTYRRRAREIGFPEEAVEVRQRVAHGAAMPSLSELRWVCGLVLQYLFQHYWVEQERQIQLMTPEEQGMGEEKGSSAPAGKAALCGGSGGGGTRARRQGGRGGRQATRQPAPETSIDEMKQLLAQLGSGSEDDAAEREAEAEERKPLSYSEAGRADGHTYAGGWTVA